MVAEVRITGLEKFAKLGRDLKAAGEQGRGLKRSLTAASRVAAKPMVEAARESARDHLPKRGGLNEFIASARFSVSNRMGGSSNTIGTRIVAKKAGGRKGSHDLRAFDDGEFRHPVFGKWRKNTPPQEIEAGWFTKPLQELAPAVMAEFRLSMNMIARRLERGNF